MDSFYLLIDLGNSFCKFSLFNITTSKIEETKTILFTEVNHIISTKFQKYNISSAIICSVKNNKNTAELLNIIKINPDCELELFDPLKYQLLSSEYKDFSSLGADRWAAILAIYLQQNNNFCVIDCGTAITVDYVIDGIHKGGLIGPGINTLSNCLFKMTDHLPNMASVPKTQKMTFYSTTTSMCISNASKLYFSAFIESVLQENKKKYGNKFVTYLSGGDYLLFNNDKKYNLDYRPNLVIDGLLKLKKFL